MAGSGAIGPASLLHPSPGRDEAGDLRREPDRLAIRGRGRVVGRVGDRNGRAPRSVSAGHPSRRRAAASSSAAGWTPAEAAPPPAVTGDRRAPAASAAGRATGESRSPRTTRGAPGRGCRSRNRPARRGRRPGSRCATRSRRCLRDRLWLSRSADMMEIFSRLAEVQKCVRVQGVRRSSGVSAEAKDCGAAHLVAPLHLCTHAPSAPTGIPS